MKKQPLNKEFKRMQKLAGLVTEASINDKGELEDFDFSDDNILSKEEWDKYYKEYEKNGLNWLLRQFLTLDGEEEKTKDMWDYDISDIMIQFKIKEKPASIIYDIFQIFKSGFKSSFFFPKGVSDEKAEDYQDYFESESYAIKKAKVQKLAKELSQYATPKELFNTNYDAWEMMAWLDIDEYDKYVELANDL
jgi:hypothetical protein